MCVFVDACITNLLFGCLAISIYIYISQTNLLPLVSAHAVLAEEDHSCNSRALGVPVHCTSCYSSSPGLRLSFLLLDRPI